MRINSFLTLIFLSRVSLKVGELLKDNVRASICSRSNAEMSWEFESGFDGWQHGIDNESSNNIYEIDHAGSRITLHFHGSSPFIESPILRMDQCHQRDFKENENSISGYQGWKLVARYRSFAPLHGGRIILKDTFEKHHNLTSGVSTNENLERQYNITTVGDGVWHILYVNLDIDSVISTTTLKRIRIYPGNASFLESGKPKPYASSLSFDWIRIVHAPMLKRIIGCSMNQYSTNQMFTNVSYSFMTNGADLQYIINTEKARDNFDEFPFARTYNCQRNGKETITIEGDYFTISGAPAHVFIDGSPCTNVRHDPHVPEKLLTCVTSKLIWNKRSTDSSDSTVQIQDAKLPGLSDTSLYLRYATRPPAPEAVRLSNFASRSIDVSWKPGGALHNHVTFTGYVIKWRRDESDDDQSMVVGNVTMTTVRELHHDTNYCFSVSALNENQMNDSWWKDLDPYGRRDLDRIITGALEGQSSQVKCGRTLKFDVEFDFFNANQTQDYGPIDIRRSIGPTGLSSGEGHYGLILVGDATVENCNSSSICCDEYDPHQYRFGCSQQSMTCRKSLSQNYILENMEETRKVLPGSGFLVQPLKSISHSFSFLSRCGPALRLTGAYSNQRGALWYPRQLSVLDGFDTNFTFRISNPSTRCKNLQGIFDYCRSRGGDGFAFVIQTDGDEAIGGYGHDLGYGGINNSLSVEFDTYYNFEDEDEPYENHISVHTGGKHKPNNAKHRFSLGDTTMVEDLLTNGEQRIRIKYEPYIDEAQLSKPSFTMTNHSSNFLHDRLQSDWTMRRIGPGLLYIYYQALVEPVLIIPLDISMALDLYHGRAWVGFTASTGNDSWQVHDIMRWTFRSLRMTYKNDMSDY